MGMIAFLRRIAGADEASKQTDRNFRERLNGVDRKNAELDELSGQLDEVLEAVSRRQRQISIDSLPSRASGEHRLELKRGEPSAQRESDPAVEGEV